MTALDLLTCVVLIFISAFSSASEIALFSLSRFQIRSLKERFRVAHGRIKRLLADPGGLLVTILVVSEIVNIALSSIITRAIARSPKPSILLSLPLPVWALDMILDMLVTTPIVLFLCEITPKALAARANRLIAPMTVGLLSFLYDLAKPIRLILKRLVEKISDWATPKQPETEAQSASEEDESAGRILRESDFLMMIEEGHKEGAIQQNELDLIKNVFELDDTPVTEILTPYSQVQTLSEKTTLRNALQSLRSLKFSRIPITRESTGGTRRQIVGVLYIKDLLRAKLEPEFMTLTVDSMMRKPLFVSPAMRLNALFRKLKQQKTHMGIVQGQAGEVLGIVTMSDVLNSLFEELLP